MINRDDEVRIAEGFGLYEHDWTFAACYLGEPFLIDDCLAYFDGRTINVAAFPVGNVRGVISHGALSNIVERLSSENALELVHVWGRFEVVPEIVTRSATLSQVDPNIATEYGGEFTIKLGNHDLAVLPEAKKAARAIKNKRIRVTVGQHEIFRSDHYRLVEEWVRTRPIGPPSVSAMAALPAYVRNPHVSLIEAYSDNKMRGFGVISTPTARDGVLIATFSERYPGARIEDQLMLSAIEFCKARNISTLHLGYSGTDSLTRFKLKWGAKRTGPGFSEAVYCVREVDTMANEYTFFWPSRLHSTKIRGRSREEID